MANMLEKHDIGLQKAISAAGSAGKLALLLKITPQAISQWTVVPLNRVFDVEAVTGLSREVIRPDFFGEQAGTEPAPADHEIAS